MIPRRLSNDYPLIPCLLLGLPHYTSQYPWHVQVKRLEDLVPAGTSWTAHKPWKTSAAAKDED